MRFLQRCFLLLLLPQWLYAATLTLDFDSNEFIDSGDLIWNRELQVLHPSLQVKAFNGGASSKDFAVGDGRHGPFELSTYGNFSEGGDLSGNIIRLNTNDYPILYTTRFILDSGWTLRVMGENPLIIYSLSDVQIVGDIDCQGRDGGNATNANPGSGGEGRCGGTSGGDGGAPGLAGDNGIDFPTSVTGGRGGNFTGGAAVAGGGGGSWSLNSASGAGANSSPAGGQGGDQLADIEFDTILGGAGGGGGSATATDAGAGGGAGGGIVIIHAVRDFLLGSAPSSTGQGRILISGGQGGNSNVQGGAGGGGGGGALQVFAGRGMEIYNDDGAGAVNIAFGSGGSNGLAAAGGNGGGGRNWFSNEDGKYNLEGTGFYTPAEEAPLVPGKVEFNANAQSIETKSFDLANSFATIQSIAFVPDSADFAFEISGSDDNFNADDTGWTTDLSDIAEKRFIKLRISITTSNVNNPDMLSQVIVTYSPGDKDNFDFDAVASCGLSGSPPKSNSFLWLMLFPLLILLGYPKLQIKTLGQE